MHSTIKHEHNEMQPQEASGEQQPKTDVVYKGSNPTWFTILFYPLSIFYLEVVLKFSLDGNIFDRYFLYIFLFSLSIGLLLYFFCNLAKNNKVNRTLSIISLAVISLIFIIEFFCKQTFTYFMGLQVILSATGDVVGSYSGNMIGMVLKSFHIVLLFFLPLIVYIFYVKKPVTHKPNYIFTRWAPCIAGVLSYLVVIVVLFNNNAGIIKDKEYYRSEFDLTESSNRFGLATGFRLDIEYLIFGTPKSATPTDVVLPDPIDVPGPSTSSSRSQQPVVYEKNIMQIDFDALASSTSDETIKDMHAYFAGQPGTMQNEYTGMFADKNVIFIIAEAFSNWAISEELTPTLYKMQNEGFVFTNYYQPAWGVSTSDGEYSALTGNLPKSGVNSMKVSADNNMHFTLGNQFSRLGYTTLAYHNNTHTYYSRNITHPNLGYSKFIAIGSGLEGLSGMWPRSDKEMIEHSVADYMYSNKPFHVYYMTVSGHCLYTFSDNAISNKNKDAVSHISASEPVRGYLAANLELEYAMEYLVSALEEAGIADDTVIVITADHYPYGLEKGFQGNTADYIDELAGEPVERNMELHKNALIIWSGALEDKEPVIIDKPCYSLDVLPTVSNLFGLNYDSRLLAGQDILSTSAPLVLFRNYSWITEKGRFDAKTNTFTPNQGVNVDATYIKNVTAVVKNRVNYSKLVLERDYYSILFG